MTRDEYDRIVEMLMQTLNKLDNIEKLITKCNTLADSGTGQKSPEVVPPKSNKSPVIKKDYVNPLSEYDKLPPQQYYYNTRPLRHLAKSGIATGGFKARHQHTYYEDDL